MSPPPAPSRLCTFAAFLFITAGFLGPTHAGAQSVPPKSSISVKAPATPSESALSTASKKREANTRKQATPKTGKETGTQSESSATPGNTTEADSSEQEIAKSELATISEELTRSSDSLAALRKRFSSLGGVAKNLLRPRLARDQRDFRRALSDAASSLLSPETVGSNEERDRAREELAKLLKAESIIIVGQFKKLQSTLFARIDAVEKATADTLKVTEDERNEALADAQELVNELDASIRARDELDLNTKADTSLLEKSLHNSSTTVSGLLLEISEQITELMSRPQEDQDKLRPELDSHQGYLDALVDFQNSSIKIMSSRGMETSELRQGIIHATGQLSRDILDTKVATGLLAKWRTDTREWALENGPRWGFKTASFLLVVFLFWLMGTVVRASVRLILIWRSSGTLSLASEFFVNTTGRLFTIAGLIFGVMQLGVEIGPLLAGLGVAGFVVGFALQNTLSNFASGLMILFYRPFDVGDIVEAGGIKGTVKEMNLVSTSIITFDNQMLIVPNNKIWGDVICNVTHQAVRRVDLEFHVGRGDDVSLTEEVLMKVLQENEAVLEDPAPVVRLHKLEPSSLLFVARPWVKTSDYWSAYWDITREVKERFDSQGITIPAPQSDVRILRD